MDKMRASRRSICVPKTDDVHQLQTKDLGQRVQPTRDEQTHIHYSNTL